MDGFIETFNHSRGYGFIRPLIGKPGAPPVFFHVSALKGHTAPAGARVSFVLTDGRKGPQAADIELKRLSGAELWPTDEPRSPNSRKGQSK